MVTHRSFIWFLPYLTAGAALYPGISHGQDLASQSTDIAGRTHYNDIIVTAQRRAERLQDVPVSIIAQTGEDLRNANVNNMRDLGLIVPGLTFSSNSMFAQPAIRGIQTTLSQVGADSPVAIYVDGVYQSNQMANSFDLPDIERIEVLKGPQGTLYGRNATGGAISVHTKEPTFDTTGYVSLSGSLYAGGPASPSGEIVAKGYVSSGLIDDVLAISLSGYKSHTGGYLHNDVTNKRTGKIDNSQGRVKILFKPAPSLKFILSGMIGKLKDYARGDIVPLNGVTTASFYPDAIIPTKPWHVASELQYGAAPAVIEHKAVALNSEYVIDGIGAISSLTSYTHVKAKTISDVDGAYSPSCIVNNGCVLYDLRYGPSKSFQQDVIFSSEKFGKVSFLIGAFYYWGSHQLGSNVNPPLSPDGRPMGMGAFFAESTIKTKAYAGFGEVNYDITDKLHATAGVRYSWEKKTGRGSVLGGVPFSFGDAPIDTAWTPRFSLRYEVTDNANIYATYSQGFKSGVLDSAGLSNQSARPEEVTSYEIGAKISQPTFGFNIAGFHYDYKDLQVQFFDGTRTILGNAASARLYGLDFDGNVLILDGLRIRFGGAWLPHAKYRSFPTGIAFDFPMTPTGMQQVVVNASGARMLKAPRFTGNAGINYALTLPHGKLEADANVQYSSTLNWNLLHRIQTRRYAILGAQIAYTPDASPVRISLWARNITNKAYIAGGTPSRNADGIQYAPPRSIGLNVDYNF